MRLKFFVGVILCWLMLLLMGCGSEYPGVVLKAIPIAVSQLTSEEVDIEFVIKQIEERTKNKLPNAYFTGLVFWGQCQNLLQRQGHIVITYADVVPAANRSDLSHPVECKFMMTVLSTCIKLLIVTV